MNRFLVPLMMLACCLTSCNKEDDPIIDDLKKLVIGQSIDLGTNTITVSGGQVRISKPGTPVDGLEIDIPANSFATEQHVRVTYAEIKNHDLGVHVNPISPLINIRMEGGYAAEIMRLTIPVNVPEGYIPIGFYFDGATGMLEGIPFESISSTSITLLTRHFSAPSELKSTGNQQQGKLATDKGGANILVSSISESILKGQAIIASGFKPGTDDWEFVNYGSYIAPRGQCAGQNMAAMWYYFEKKPTEGKLFDRFSELPNLWQDNARGYRFCSVIHKDLEWDGTIATIFDKYIDKNQELDRYKLMTIAGTMLVTGEPQGVGIYRQTGTKEDGSPTYGGHDLICYQVSVNAGTLYISDPNTPAAGQLINLVDNKFQPYLAKLNGEDVSNPYPFITYYAKTAYIEWSHLGKRWDEVINNTIGTVAPNAFPAYTIRIKDAIGIELTNGMKVTEDTLTLVVECPTAEASYQVQNKRLIGFDVFNQEGQSIGAKINNYTKQVLLKPGPNKLGFYIFGFRESSKDENGHYRNRYIDFKWVTVNYLPLVIEPDLLNGEPNKPYKFTAKSKGTAPASARYAWNFGDGSNTESIVNDSTVTHTFTKEGAFRVKVELFDHATNTKIADTTSIANIQEVKPIPVIDSLGTMIYFKNGRKLMPWGHKDIGGIRITIYGRDWLVDSGKTVVRVDGTIVPITNLISVGSGKYEVNKNEINIDIPADKHGNISITVESGEMASEMKNYFVGIPLSALQKMPVAGMANLFRVQYINTNEGNRVESNSYSFQFYRNNSQIESVEWNGYDLTIRGKIENPGYQGTLNQVVYSFSEDGTKVTNIQSGITSLNLDLEHSTKDLYILLDTHVGHLRFERSKIPATDYTLVKGKVKTTKPLYIYDITGFIDGLTSWPNETRLYLEFIN